MKIYICICLSIIGFLFFSCEEDEKLRNHDNTRIVGTWEISNVILQNCKNDTIKRYISNYLMKEMSVSSRLKNFVLNKDFTFKGSSEDGTYAFYYGQLVFNEGSNRDTMESIPSIGLAFTDKKDNNIYKLVFNDYLIQKKLKSDTFVKYLVNKGLDENKAKASINGDELISIYYTKIK